MKTMAVDTPPAGAPSVAPPDPRSSRCPASRCRFGGVGALTDVSFDGRPRRALRRDRPERRRQDLHPQLPERRVPAAVWARAARWPRPGRPCVRRPRPKRASARTFQNLALFANLTVIDNLMLGRHHLMKTGPVAGALWWGPARREEIAHRRRCAEIMDLLDLGPYRHHPVGLLPFGIQKRIELGRALAMDPKLLLLDEPVAGHEPRGDRGHGGAHLRDPQGARRGDDPRRAPDGPRHGPRRPAARAGLREGRGHGRSSGDRRPTRTSSRPTSGPRHDRACAARPRWSVSSTAPFRRCSSDGRRRSVGGSRCATTSSHIGASTRGRSTRAHRSHRDGPARARRAAGRPCGDPQREPTRVGDDRPRRPGHRLRHRRRVPDQPERRGRVPAAPLPGGRPRRRGRGAARQGPRGASRTCRTCGSIVVIETRGVRRHLDDPMIMTFAELEALGAGRLSRRVGRARRAAAARRRRHDRLHLRNHRAAQGRHALPRQPARGDAARSARSSRRRPTTRSSPTCRSATSPSG